MARFGSLDLNAGPWLSGQGIHGMGQALRQGVDRAVNESRLRLAVTGLSRSGKTVFITSLIANLLAMGRGQNTLPAFSAALAAEGRAIAGVTLLPADTQEIGWFDAIDKLRAMAGEQPHWPPRTSDLSSVTLMLSLTRRGRLGQWLPARRIRLEILDAPGEWLLDLALLESSFDSWSRATLARLRQPPLAEVFTEFLRYTAMLRPQDPPDEAVIRQAHRLYVSAMERARDGLGMVFLQPGRFLRPGPQGESPMMWFFPYLPSEGGAPLAALLARRFDAYRDNMRRQYFDRFFTDFDRQLVLVDVLGALCEGEAVFRDTTAAVEQIARAYDQRWHRSWWPWQPPRRLAFAATKADHVPAPQRPALDSLLRAMLGVAEVVGTAPQPGTPTDMAASPATMSPRFPLPEEAGPPQTEGLRGGMARAWPSRGAAQQRWYGSIAALRCTEDGTHEGSPVVIGVPEGQLRSRPFRAGYIPPTVPTPEDPFWQRPRFTIPAFRPPVLDPHGAQGMPMLAMDNLLVWLLGDAL